MDNTYLTSRQLVIKWAHCPTNIDIYSEEDNWISRRGKAKEAIYGASVTLGYRTARVPLTPVSPTRVLGDTENGHLLDPNTTKWI